MDVSTIRIRHYAPEGAQCAPVKETYETLSNMMEQLGPKLARIGFPVTLEKASSEGDPSKNNMVTLESAGIDFPETPLDEILGLEASPKPCDCSAGEGHGECRTIEVAGETYQTIPPGLIADGLLRVALSSTGGCGSGCGTCGGGCGV